MEVNSSYEGLQYGSEHVLQCYKRAEQYKYTTRSGEALTLCSTRMISNTVFFFFFGSGLNSTNIRYSTS